MSKIDRIREEIGWLKLVFGVLVAIDASLVAWFAQNYTTAAPVLLLSGFTGIGVVSIVVVQVSRLALRRFEEVEKL